MQDKRLGARRTYRLDYGAQHLHVAHKPRGRLRLRIRLALVEEDAKQTRIGPRAERLAALVDPVDLHAMAEALAARCMLGSRAVTASCPTDLSASTVA